MGLFRLGRHGAGHLSNVPARSRSVKTPSGGCSRAFRPPAITSGWIKTSSADLQERIVAYYEGEPVDFSADPAVSLNGAGPFVHKVLQACRMIAFGQTKTYSDLARQVGSPNAARAVGSVMAGNPVPLIIPCHRVLRTDGGLGGFSAPGGTATKQKMLHHEQAARPRPQVAQPPSAGVFLDVTPATEKPSASSKPSRS